MIDIKLTRQQIEAIQVYFFPYMEMLCITKVNDTTSPDPLSNLDAEIVQSLIQEIIEYFKRVEKTKYKDFPFDLTQAQAMAFWKLLKQLPINVAFQWLNDLCEHLIETIENQVWK